MTATAVKPQASKKAPGKAPESKPQASKKAPAEGGASKKGAIKAYRVIEPLRHDGRWYPEGATLEVGASTAKRLRALGVIK